MAAAACGFTRVAAQTSESAIYRHVMPSAARLAMTFLSSNKKKACQVAFASRSCLEILATTMPRIGCYFLPLNGSCHGMGHPTGTSMNDTKERGKTMRLAIEFVQLGHDTFGARRRATGQEVTCPRH